MWMVPFIKSRKSRCKQTRELLSAYIDSGASPKEQATVERHLAECQGCQEELASLQATVRLMRRVPQLSPSRSFAVAEPRALPRRSPFPALRTATAVLAVFLVFFFAADMANLFEARPATTEEGGAAQSGSEQEEVGAGGCSENELSCGLESDDSDVQPRSGEKTCVQSAGNDGTAQEGTPDEEGQPPTASADSDALSPYGENELNQQDGASGNEDAAAASAGQMLSVGEASWLHPLEYGLLGVVVVLGGMAVVSWRRGKKPVG